MYGLILLQSINYPSPFLLPYIYLMFEETIEDELLNPKDLKTNYKILV